MHFFFKEKHIVLTLTIISISLLSINSDSLALLLHIDRGSDHKKERQDLPWGRKLEGREEKEVDPFYEVTTQLSSHGLYTRYIKYSSSSLLYVRDMVHTVLPWRFVA